MIPSPWEFALLALAAYRLTRLVGWDEWPPVERARAWLIGERWLTQPQQIARAFDVPPEIIGIDPPDGPPSRKPSWIHNLEVAPWLAGKGEPCEPDPPELPGKQPSSLVENVRPAYDRPTLAHLVHCPFCLGWWISLATWLAWLAGGDWTLLALTPWAISGAVGVVAKNLDP